MLSALTATTGSFSGTLGVTGATTLSGTLGVIGASTFSSGTFTGLVTPGEFVLPVGTPPTVAALPTCAVGLKFHIRGVSDALVPVWGAAVAGGGAIPVAVLCDGAGHWNVM
jgi:hypothetical protein